MKGRLHIPVMAFALGGILSTLTGFSFIMIIAVICGWMFFIKHLIPLIVITLISLTLGFFYLAPHSPPPLIDPFIETEGTIISNPTITPHMVRMLIETKENDRLQMVYFFEEDQIIFPEFSLHEEEKPRKFSRTDVEWFFI